MKLLNLIKAALATGGLACLAATSQAVVAADFNYNQNAHDLLLLFRSSSTGDPNDLIVNLGPAEAMKTRAAGVLSEVSGSQVLAVFGAVDNYVRWSAAGYAPPGSQSGSEAPDYTVWATKPVTIADPGWPRYSEDTQTGAGAPIMTVGQGAMNKGSDLSSTATTVGKTAEVSYTSKVTSSGNWNYFSASVERRNAGSLTLFEMLPSDGGGFGVPLGTFELASTGEVTWTPVPEPGTYGLLAGLCGIGLLGLNNRRRLSP